MRIKYLLLFAVVAIIGFTTSAQQLRVVDNDGLPIGAVCVTNENGALVGTTDNDGYVTNSKGVDQLFFSHVAFKPKSVLTDTLTSAVVVMDDVNYELGELNVKPKELAYVQTYYRCAYVTDEGPIYFRSGVSDNTYEFAKKKITAKKRSVARGKNQIYRFIISTFIGGTLDKWASLDTTTLYTRVNRYARKGKITITEDLETGRKILSDSISTLGYIEDDLERGERTVSFDLFTFHDHIDAAEAEKKGKKKKKSDSETTHSHYFEKYRIDEHGKMLVGDIIIKQALVTGHMDQLDTDYVILFEGFTTGRDYIDKKEFKQTRKDNEVEMNIVELRQFEQAHNIPPMAPNIRAQIDKLFKKELSK